ncbi:MAG TPA: GNAT family N-acetyltransferase [Beijerinckiaceae bacterium]|jgi:RimJ/RimL family protein N-acetyltransferase|nr:GNAT family N-acetyltransferase [Beijerinckiaceae bacterium]
MIPTLTTSRLILRPLRAQDWPAYRDFLASERARYMGGPFALRMAWGMFCSDHALWDFHGCGALMIDERDSGLCVGQVGINAGPLFPEWELGWLLYSGAEGKGYAFEAASALRDWAREDRRLSTLVSYVDPQNERSRRLAERLGATLDDEAPRLDPVDLVYRYFRL